VSFEVLVDPALGQGAETQAAKLMAGVDRCCPVYQRLLAPLAGSRPDWPRAIGQRFPRHIPARFWGYTGL